MSKRNQWIIDRWYQKVGYVLGMAYLGLIGFTIIWAFLLGIAIAITNK